MSQPTFPTTLWGNGGQTGQSSNEVSVHVLMGWNCCSGWQFMVYVKISLICLGVGRTVRKGGWFGNRCGGRDSPHRHDHLILECAQQQSTHHHHTPNEPMMAVGASTTPNNPSHTKRDHAYHYAKHTPDEHIVSFLLYFYTFLFALIVTSFRSWNSP